MFPVKVSVIVPVFTDVQLPEISEPVTVNERLEGGAPEIVAPLKFPGIQVYVVPPEPVSEVELPTQMLVLLAVAAIVGNGLTVTVTVATFWQPAPTTPVTV